MNMKPESEIISEDEINLYDYWKVLVKRKKILLCIFLVPLVTVSIISLIQPRYYRGESEIINPVIPASNIVNLVGNIDDTQKVKIFANNPGAIKSVSLSLPKKSTDKVNIIIDAKTADIIPQAFKDIFDYIGNMPEIKGVISQIQAETDLKTDRFLEETDFKIKNLIEVRKANLIFLKYITDMMNKRQTTTIVFNPAELINKDGDLSLEIINLQQAKTDTMNKKELNITKN